MRAAQKGDTVVVHYTGRRPDGSVFDTSEDGKPLEFTLGDSEVIPGFQQIVEGMKPGQKKTGTVTAADAYGDRRPDLILEFPRADFPDEIDPKVGKHLKLEAQDGRELIVRVTKVTPSVVLLDANHPLAGEDLTFDIKLMAIRETT